MVIKNNTYSNTWGDLKCFKTSEFSPKEKLQTIHYEIDGELKKKFYSIKEASQILKLDYQTVRSHILKSNLKAEKIGRFYRIRHFDLMDALNDVKSLKYKR